MYFVFDKILKINTVLAINFIGFGQPCPNEIDHNQNSGKNKTTIYVYNASGKIIGQGECTINGGGKTNCNSVLNNLDDFLPEIAEYLSFGDITKEEDLGSCLYDTKGKKIDPLLPVQLLFFNAIKLEKNQVVIQWATSSETNNKYFTIEKSKNGKVWKKIQIKPGAGNSTHRIDYKYIDQNPHQKLPIID